MTVDPELEAVRRKLPGFVIDIARLRLWGDAPVTGFVAAIASPSAALPSSNAAARRVVSGLDATFDGAIERTIGEAIERYSTCFHDVADERSATGRELGADAAPVDALQLVSERQRAFAEIWNRRHPGRHAIAPRFDDNVNVGWMRPAAQFSSAPHYVPAAIVKLGHPDRRAVPALQSSSVGTAHGQNSELAILRATLELIEHDAVAVWWYNGLVRPPLEIVGSRLIDDVCGWLRNLGRRLHLIDLTHDIGVPVVASVVTDQDGRRPVVGSAAALDLREAAESALREALLGVVNLRHLEVTYEAHGFAPFDADTAALIAWHRAESLLTAPWLAPTDAASLVMNRPVLSDLAGLRARLESGGLELLAFDLTRPGDDGAVFKVVVPGLRPTLARFAPGRLYTVPIGLGWRKVATAEAALLAEPYLN